MQEPRNRVFVLLPIDDKMPHFVHILINPRNRIHAILTTQFDWIFRFGVDIGVRRGGWNVPLDSIWMSIQMENISHRNTIRFEFHTHSHTLHLKSIWMFAHRRRERERANALRNICMTKARRVHKQHAEFFDCLRENIEFSNEWFEQQKHTLKSSCVEILN